MLRKFYDELKRRKVDRSAVGYLIVAWVLLQLGDVVVEPLGLPGWVQTVLIIGLVALFPVVLVVAWVYELKSGRFIREVEAPAAENEPVPALADATQAEPVTPRLAVLPFAMLGGDGDEDYLGDGMAEEIINTVARHKQLQVIARTSSFRFRGIEVDMEAIRTQLTASYVITGSVRRSGDKLRISVQLIDAASESQMWAETYQRTGTDVFEVQADIARGVGEQLLATMGLEATESSREWRPSPEAYEQYLMATAAFRRADFPNALRYAARSEEIDPDNPVVPTLMAEVYLNWPRYGFVTTRDELTRARQHASRALELDPQYLPARSAMGMLSLYMGRDFKAAFEAVAHASIEQPGLVEWLPVLLAYANRYEDAVEIQRRIVQRDPLNTVNLLTWASRLNWLGRWEEAVAATERARELDPKHLILNSNDYRWAIRDGNFDRARAMLESWGLNPDKPGERRRVSWLPRSIGPWLGARLYGEMGELEVAAALVRELEQEDGFTPTTVAEAYVSAGAIDDAYRIVELGISRFDPGIYDVARPHDTRDPANRFWIEFSSDPRYDELLVRLGIDRVSLEGVNWQLLDRVLR